MWVEGLPEGQAYRWGEAQVREGVHMGKVCPWGMDLREQRPLWVRVTCEGGVHVGEGTAPRCHQGPQELGPQGMLAGS